MWAVRLILALCLAMAASAPAGADTPRLVATSATLTVLAGQVEHVPATGRGGASDGERRSGRGRPGVAPTTRPGADHLSRRHAPSRSSPAPRSRSGRPRSSARSSRVRILVASGHGVGAPGELARRPRHGVDRVERVHRHGARRPDRRPDTTRRELRLLDAGGDAAPAARGRSARNGSPARGEGDGRGRPPGPGRVLRGPSEHARGRRRRGRSSHCSCCPTDRGWPASSSRRRGQPGLRLAHRRSGRSGPRHRGAGRSGRHLPARPRRRRRGSVRGDRDRTLPIPSGLHRRVHGRVRRAGTVWSRRSPSRWRRTAPPIPGRRRITGGGVTAPQTLPAPTPGTVLLSPLELAATPAVARLLRPRHVHAVPVRRRRVGQQRRAPAAVERDGTVVRCFRRQRVEERDRLGSSGARGTA